jgi:predicted  nucleic acid-binding Zn-ribbon protein
MTEKTQDAPAEPEANRDAVPGAELSMEDWNALLARAAGTEEAPATDKAGGGDEPDAETPPAGDNDGQETDDDRGAEDDEAHAEKEVEADPWAEAPEALRNEYQALKDERDRLNHRLRSNDGRVGALQRQINDLTRRLQETSQKRDETATAPAKDEQAQGKTADEERRFDILREEYPEIAEGLLEEFARRDQALEAMRGEIETLRDQPVVQAVEAHHPGFRQTLDENRDAFEQWVDDMPRVVRDTVEAQRDRITDPEAFSKILAAFKRDMGLAPPTEQDHKPAASKAATPDNADRRRQRQLAAGSGTRTQPSGPPQRSPEADWQALLKRKAQQYATG